MTGTGRRRKAVIGGRRLEGEFALPALLRGFIVFSHGSGSSQLSPRNTHVAEALRRRGLATLLFDLLTEAEALDRRNVFVIALLAARVGEALAWSATDAEAAGLPIGLFGASTGAAAALAAAAAAPNVAAVVFPGGRPDLAGDALDRVRAPVLLIVGGAAHPFEELCVMAPVVTLAGDWFEEYLRGTAT